jgi:hypothetical protein
MWSDKDHKDKHKSEFVILVRSNLWLSVTLCGRSYFLSDDLRIPDLWDTFCEITWTVPQLNFFFREHRIRNLDDDLSVGAVAIFVRR